MKQLHLPDPEFAKQQGWTHQVSWESGGLPCWIRCKSKEEAEGRASRLRAEGEDVVITNLAGDA